MKLYLSSYHVPTPRDLAALLRRPIKGAKVGIIINAKDHKSNEAAREFRLHSLKDVLQDFGFKASFIDLRDYLSAKEIETALCNFDLIWAAGGNTFVLMHEMKRSGFDIAIKKLLEQGVVYGGESAGAVVAGTTLKGIELADDPEEAKHVIWDGMALADKIIVPHANNVEFEYVIDKIVKLHHSSQKLVLLNDNQALVVNGSAIHISTAK